MRNLEPTRPIPKHRFADKSAILGRLTGRIGARLRTPLIALALTLVFFATARADAVRLATGILVKGEITEITEEQVRIVPDGSRQPRSFPRSSVTYVEVGYLPSHQQGKELLDRGRPAEAAPLLENAVRAETRPWLRRKALGDLMRAYQEAGAHDLALRRLIDVANDRQSLPEWGSLPIWWFREAPPDSTLVHARQLASSTRVEAAITGASYLLAASGQQRQLAVGLLHQYTDDVEPVRRTVARSLLALHGHLRVDVEDLRADAEALPFDLQAGPYFCLAQILERQGKPLEAALAYLRVAVLHSQRRFLAPRALARAASLLEQIGFKSEATSLYRELASRYPETREGAAAAARSENR